MASQSQIRILEKGVQFWNRWRLHNPGRRPDFSKANLSAADLRGANLCSADLHGADLSHSDLSSANLQGANLRRTVLSDSNLRGANLTSANLNNSVLVYATLAGAQLSRANLTQAFLLGTDLSGSDLRRANFTGAHTASVRFGNLDLSTVTGLGTVEHLGASSVGADTLYRSNGNIPEAFLRGCGLADELIAFTRSLRSPGPKAGAFNSCFISYSGKDGVFAKRLHADLQSRGVRCWFAPHDTRAGEKIHEQIDDAIHTYDRLLLILSPHSIHSPWVRTEILRARKRELKEKRRMLFPIRLMAFNALRDWQCFDSDSGTDLAHEIREYLIPDFTDWRKKGPYTKALEKLLTDLRNQPAKLPSGRRR